MNKMLILIAVYLPFSAFATGNEKRVKSEIKEVTVYLSGAQVTSTANVNLAPGTTQVIFEDLSKDVNEDNIQARGEGDLTILSVMKKMNYLDQNVTTKEIAQLQDSLESLQNKLEMQQSMWKIYDQEELMMMSNKDIGGKNTGVSVTELQKAADLFRSRLTEIETKKLETKIKEKKLQEQIEKIDAQLGELNAKKQKVTSEVCVTVSCKSNVNAKLYLSYVLESAGWAPFYNIRATDNSSPIKLEYLANVWQNTGYDWKNVKLTLATSNPYLSGSKPNMAVWWIYPYQPVSYLEDEEGGNYTISPNSDGKNDQFTPMDKIILSSKRKERSSDIYPIADSTKMSENTSIYTTITQSQVNTSFDISLPYDVPSDNKPYAVDVQTYTIPASYKYYCAPKLDKDAFLIAKVTGWDQYNLLSGNANIFYEGMYVGRSMINAQNTSDTLDISLGRDKNVVVSREKLKDLSERKLIGSTQKETFMYEFTVRNKKKQDIDIEIEDQVPISQNKDITVELVESSDAKYNKETGKLNWQMKVSTSDSKKFRFGFSVKYPKDQTVSNLNS